MTRISLVAAVARNGVIGRDNRLPWRLPADLQHFKRLTMGKPVVMGRRTWQSLRRPLPGRRNIIVTRDPAFRAEGGEVTHSIAAAMQAVSGSEEVMIIGGAGIFADTLPMADRLYLTEVRADVEGDVYFPPIEAAEWVEVERRCFRADDNNDHDYDFVLLERRPAAGAGGS